MEASQGGNWLHLSAAMDFAQINFMGKTQFGKSSEIDGKGLHSTYLPMFFISVHSNEFQVA
jgi:hypothetical protein